jgi:hypothetical protein
MTQQEQHLSQLCVWFGDWACVDGMAGCGREVTAYGFVDDGGKING